MGSMGNQNPATAPSFALHLIKLEQVAGGALATFRVLDRDPLQQMAVTVYATNDTDGTGGMIARAREEAINLLRRSICLLHAERTVEGEGHSKSVDRWKSRTLPHRPRARQDIELHEATGLSFSRE